MVEKKHNGCGGVLLALARQHRCEKLGCLCIAGALLLEQNDEWLVGRRYFSQESLSALAQDQPGHAHREINKEVAQLQPA